MARIQLIKQKLSSDSGFDGLTDQQAMDRFNQSIVIKQSFSTELIYRYLTLVGKLLAIESSAEDEARQAARALQIFDVFDLTDSLVSDKLNAILSGLVTKGLISTTDESIIKSLGDKTTSISQELGLAVVGLAEIERAKV